jgi:hypothetical protein
MYTIHKNMNKLSRKCDDSAGYLGSNKLFIYI